MLVLALAGDKIVAGILAQSAGVPMLPWSGSGLRVAVQHTHPHPHPHQQSPTADAAAELERQLEPRELVAGREVSPELYARAAVESVEQARAVALHIGFPVMLKAAAGGGGRGASSPCPALPLLSFDEHTWTRSLCSLLCAFL